MQSLKESQREGVPAVVAVVGDRNAKEPGMGRGCDGARGVGSRIALLVPLALLAAGCASESRLLRISPLSSSSTSDARLNVFPLAYSDGDATSILWPLIDFDRKGFAVRPLVSKDDEQLDILFPLSHFDMASGDGWALTGYSCGDNLGFFPLCNFGPSFNYATLAWWWKEGGDVSSWGFFPLAWIDPDAGEGLVLNGYSLGGNKGLAPLFNLGPDFNYVGLAWWQAGRAEGDAQFGLFPLFSAGAFSSVGPIWWTSASAEAGKDGGELDGESDWGCFPLLWASDAGDRSNLAVLPVWYQSLAPEREFRAALVPPTWWETSGDVERHVVFPFYARLADADSAWTIVAPFYASREARARSDALGADGAADAASSWFTLLANGWSGADSSGLNVYPLYWSSESRDESSTLLVPFFLSQQHGDERLLLTPLGGRGWDASGATTFTNVLGPLWHHSSGPQSETTAFLWPLFQHDERGATSQTRAFPLFDVTLEPDGHDAWMLAGLARHVSDGDDDSFRLWPLWSDSEAAATPDLLFDLSLAARWSHDEAWSNHLFPLWHARGDAAGSEASALLGLGRIETTEAGHAWRLLPLASASNDPAADGWLDPFTLYRHETRGETTSDRLFPLFSRESGPDGSAWRVWPLVSAASGDAGGGFLDGCTLLGLGSDDRSWRGHLGTRLLFDWGHEVAPDAPSQTTFVDGQQQSRRVVERTHAGLLFGWFLAEQRVVADDDGRTREESHYRLPLLHEYETDGDQTEWDALLYAVHSVETPQHEQFSVLGYGYRSVRDGETTKRDIFPFITCDDGPEMRRFSFLWRVFNYEREGDKRGGHVLFIPWGDDV